MTDPRQLEFVQPSQEEKSAMSKRNCLQEDSFFDLKGDFSSAHCYRDDDGISSRQRHLLRASAASNDTQEILSSPQALPLSDEIKWNRRGVINSSMHHLQSTGGPEVCCKMKYASGR